MHCDTFKQDNYSTVGGDGGCRVSEVQTGTTSPMPDHKGFYATVTVRDPPTHTSRLRVKKMNFIYTQISNLIYLHLFSELFHEDVSPIIRRNTDCVISEYT